MRTTIYALVDPRAPGVHRYIGKTHDPRARLRRHLRAPSREPRTYRAKWIASLLREGVEPALVVLVRVPSRHEDAAERDAIRRGFVAGHPLTNGAAGGRGGRLLPEVQARATAGVLRALEEGRLRPPTMTAEQRAARDVRLSALRSDPRCNPMKLPAVVERNRAANRARNEALGRVKAPPSTKRHSPEWLAGARERALAAAALGAAATWGKKLPPRSAAHASAIAASRARKRGLLFRGAPTSLAAACRALGCDPATLRGFAARRGLSVQAALDCYRRSRPGF